MITDMPGVASQIPARAALTYTRFEAAYTRLEAAEVKEEPRWVEGDQSRATATCLPSYRYACHQRSAKPFSALRRLMVRPYPTLDAKRSLVTWRLVRKTWWRHDDLTNRSGPALPAGPLSIRGIAVLRVF